MTYEEPRDIIRKTTRKYILTDIFSIGVAMFKADSYVNVKIRAKSIKDALEELQENLRAAEIRLEDIKGYYDEHISGNSAKELLKSGRYPFGFICVSDRMPHSTNDYWCLVEDMGTFYLKSIRYTRELGGKWHVDSCGYRIKAWLK